MNEGWIDAHVHVWAGKSDLHPRAYGQPDYPPEEFTAEHYLECAGPAGIARAVLVQMSFYAGDHGYLLETVRRYPGRFAPVGLLTGPDPATELGRLGGLGLRSLRLVVGSARAPELPALWRRAASENATLCLLLDPAALPAVEELCAASPETAVVVDHLARIGMDGQIREEDILRLCGLAKHPRVHVKVSAFYALGRRRPPYTDLAPLISRVFHAFGPRRLMWGSDAPFQLEPPHDCARSIELIRDRLPFLSADDREWMLCGTAASVFFGE
jgi:predicted TIM-barrel fold metal-dependent hydrolase